MSLECRFCGAHVSQLNNLPRHQSSEACRKVQSLRDEYEKRIQELEAENLNLQAELKASHEKSSEYRSIVEKIALRPTTTNINKSRNYLLQCLAPDPIKISTLKTEMPKFATMEAIMAGEHRFNKIITTALLESNEGKFKVICTDQARKQFTYKDEKSGELISDPHLERLSDHMRKSVNYGALFNEISEKLKEDGIPEKDNAEQTHKILLRAKFRAPFVRHVAKRMYRRAIITFDDEA
jgi:hypothetical protein